MNQDKVMLLIDADNVSIDVIEQAVAWVGRHFGGPHVRRAYCTAESAVKHQGAFKRLGIRPMVNLAAGKNSTDIALAVDAIDLAVAERPDVMVIASSDSDFAPLVGRLREKGCKVVGVGQRGKTGDETRMVYDDFEVMDHRKGASRAAPVREAARDLGAPARAESGRGRGGRGGAAADRAPRAGAGGRPAPRTGAPRGEAPRVEAPPVDSGPIADVQAPALPDVPPPPEALRKPEGSGVAAEKPIDASTKASTETPAPPAAPAAKSRRGRGRGKAASSAAKAVVEAGGPALAPAPAAVTVPATMPAQAPAAQPAAAAAESAGAEPRRPRRRRTSRARGTASEGGSTPAPD